jgi:hypothetical protein
MLRPNPLVLDQDSRALYERFVLNEHPLRQMDEARDFSLALSLTNYC